MHIAPLDRLADRADQLQGAPPPDGPGAVRFSMYLKGAQAISIAEHGDEVVELKFRYRRQHRAWQMMRPLGSRWIADGTPSEGAGQLLQQLVLVMQGTDPRQVFGLPS